MATETAIILGGIGAVILAVLILRLGKRLAIGLLVLAGLAIVGAVVLSMLTQASANRETAIAAREAARAARTAAAGQTMMGAAMSITLFLVILLLILTLATGGVAFVWAWWQKQQKRQNALDMLRQAQWYAMLQGQQLPGRARRSTYSSLQSPAGYPAQTMVPPVIVVGQQSPIPYAYPNTHSPSRSPTDQGGGVFQDLWPPPDSEDWEELG